MGVLLVVGCALAFYVGSLRATGRVPVLALARNVSVGHVLSATDLRVVQVSADGSVSTVAASSASTVIGGTVAAPRPAGALLAVADVGEANFPPAGRVVVAVALKPGQFPPDVTAGAKVLVLITPADAATGTSQTTTGGAGSGGAATGGAGGGQGALRSASLSGVVLSASSPADSAGDGSSVVALLMDQNSATVVGAAAAGTISLLQLPPGSSGGG